MCWNLNSCLKYAPDNSWYILTMNEIFELGGSLVRETVSHNLMRFLAEGEFSGEQLEYCFIFVSRVCLCNDAIAIITIGD